MNTAYLSTTIPTDPLNYPLWRRDLITSILCLSSVIASTLSPLLAANTLALVLYYNSPETPGGPKPPQRWPVLPAGQLLLRRTAPTGIRTTMPSAL